MKKQILTFALNFFLLISAFANCEWIGGNGNWNDPGHWSCGRVPTPGDDVFIGPGDEVHMDIPATVRVLDMSGGKIVGGPPESLTVTTTINWKSGTIAASVIAGGGCNLILATGGTKTLDGILTNNGMGTFDAGTFIINGSGTLKNNGEFGIAGDLTISPAIMAGAIENHGIFTKAAGAGVATILPLFENKAGSLKIASGTLEMEGNFISNAKIDILPGKTLEISSDAFFNPGTEILGEGLLKLNNLSNVAFETAIDGGFNIDNLGSNATLKHPLKTKGIVNLKGGVFQKIAAAANLTIDGGTMNWEDGLLNVPTEITFLATLNFNLNRTKELGEEIKVKGIANFNDGTIDGPGSLTVLAFGALVWNKGTLNVKTGIEPSGNIGLKTGGLKKLKNIITNKGTFAWLAGTLHFINGEVKNIGTCSIQFDGSMTHPIGATGLFDNSGTMTKVLGAGIAFIGVELINSGTLEIEAGTLKKGGEKPFHNTGTIDIDMGTKLDLSTDASIHGSSTLKGKGDIAFNVGLIGFAAVYVGALNFKFKGASVDLFGTINTSGTTELSDGEVFGLGALIIAKSLAWTGGELSVTTTIIATATLALTGANDKVLDGKLTQKGTATWSAGDFVINDSGKLVNKGTFNWNAVNRLLTFYIGDNPGNIKNQEVININMGAGSLEIAVPIRNHDRINLNSGKVDMYRDLLVFDNLNLLGGTTWHARSSSSFTTFSSLSGSGTYDIKSSNTKINKDLTTGVEILVSGGNLVLNNNLICTSHFGLSAGNLKGTKMLTLMSIGTWSGGKIHTSMTVDASATLTMFGGTKTLLATLLNKGTTIWTAGKLKINDPGHFENEGDFETDFAGKIISTTVPVGIFTNTGVFSKLDAGITEIQTIFKNMLTGVVEGIGTLDVLPAFLNLGTFRPGTSTGTLTYDEVYINGTLLDIEIMDASGPGTGHDQLLVSKLMIMKNELRVTETGMVPPGDYTIAECSGGSSCRLGSFTTVDLPADYTISYHPDKVVVTKHAPSPLIGNTEENEINHRFVDEEAKTNDSIKKELAMEYQNTSGLFSIKYTVTQSNGWKINYVSPEERVLEFHLFDLSGRPVHKQLVQLFKGNGAFELTTDFLPEGMYVLNTFYNGMRVSKKLIK